MNLKKIIHESGTTVQVPKLDHVFHQGLIDRSVYWLDSGLLKAYYVTAEGKEGIKSFIQPGSIVGSLRSAYEEMPCTFSLVALEDSELIRFSFEKLMESTRQSHTVAQEIIAYLLNLSMRKEQREYEFLTLSAEERYRSLQDSDPSLLERLTQYDVARYLGITPVALSRIRRRLSSKE